jgi:predicted transposase YbfD/YdcC
LTRYLTLPHGAPSHDTLGRVFRLLDARVFERLLPEPDRRAGRGCRRRGRARWQDGSRDGGNTAIRLVSAFATASGLALCQEGAHGKGNEIAAIQALLETLALKGCIVAIDALGCQTDIAQKIVDRGGDDLLAVKDNQGHLAQALREFFEEAETNGLGALPVSRHETVEKDHGRIEIRQAVWVSHLD